MSLHHKIYTSKKTGIKTIRYYASVYNAQSGKSVVGPYREYVGPELADPKKPPKAIKNSSSLMKLLLSMQSPKARWRRERPGYYLRLWLSNG